MSKDVFKNFTKFILKHLCRSLFLNKVTGWKPETTRSSYWRYFVKKDILKNFVNFTGKHLCWSHFLIKLKKTLTKMLYWKICEIFKSNYFQEYLLTTASNLYFKKDSKTDVFLWILWIIQEHLFCRASMNDWCWTTSAEALL